jgi:3-oxoacyl-ACP reductase-like protein
VLCAHTSTHFGHQQWILFDDRWAAAHPDLAASLLHYARCWDPFAVREAPSRSPEELSAARKERAWKAAAGDRDEADARGYRPAERFAQGELVRHAKFGLGVVQRVEGGKIEVLFRDGPRTLAHGLPG